MGDKVLSEFPTVLQGLRFPLATPWHKDVTMATYRKRGSTWQVQIRVKGQSPLSRSFPTKAAGQAWAESEEKALKGGTIKIPHGYTLGCLLSEYLTVTQSSTDNAFIKTFINRCQFLDKPLAKLIATDFLAYRDSQLKTVKKTSYNRSIKPIIAAFRSAIEMKHFPADCADCLKATKLKAKATKRRRRFWDHEERAFSTVCSCPTLGAVVVVLVETAMRSGELWLVKKQNVRDGMIYIPEEDTKTKSPRTIALSPRALSAVDILMAQSATEKLVSLGAGVLKKKFRKVCHQAEIVNLHMHDLRHEALSRMSEKGFGPAEMMSQSGHTQLNQLGDYIHGNPLLIQKKLLAMSQLGGNPLVEPVIYLSHPRSSTSVPMLSEVQPTP
jgi:integrase